MASSPCFSRTHSHACSVSLPSRPHPLAPEFDKILCGLRSSEAFTSASITSQFNGLNDLHDCLHDLLLSLEAQKTLARECYERSVNEILDGSLRLLDGCEAAKSALLVTKHYVQELQSALRRRSSD
uniref:Uncharacterized protein n=1 Tax=Kalanchoe fedtschenkoi TaxID=63787 RepID=A0A7N1A3I3_KALFE